MTRALRRLGWLLVLLSLSLAEPASAAAPDVKAFSEHLEVALSAYRAGDFAAARDEFEAALGLAPRSADRANLEFNLATCDYQLGRYHEARLRFERIAAERPPSRAAALAHAGMAALGEGDIAGARALLERIEGNSPEGERERQRLQSALDAAAVPSPESTPLESAVNEGILDYRAGNLEGARSRLRTIENRSGSERTRATLQYMLGLIAREQGQMSEARERFERALSIDPRLGVARAALGELSHDQGDDERAAQDYRDSLGLDLSVQEAESARTALSALYPLPASGWAPVARLGLGWDSNATQSGSNAALGVGTAAQTASAYAAPLLSLGYRLRLSAQSLVAPYYQTDALLLMAPSLQELSLWRHGAGARFYFAPTASLALELGAGLSLLQTGLEPSTSFALEELASARVALRHTRQLRSELDLDLHPGQGLGGRDYLTGLRTDVLLSETYDDRDWGLRGWLGFRRNALGSQVLAASPERFPSCGLACTGAVVYVPLAYQGARLGSELLVAATRSLNLSASVDVEWRWYLGESYFSGPRLPSLLAVASRKKRADQRYRLGARAAYQLLRAPEIELSLDYWLLVSRSNVAFNPRDRAHAFDYDDRNFAQHLIELGVQLRP